MRWKYWAAAVAVLVQVAWYEVVYIFPSNDRIIEIGDALERPGKEDLDENTTVELNMVLKKWQRRNLVRASTPLVTALIGLWSIV